MRISPISYNNRVNFSGIKERDDFRQSATRVLRELEQVEPGTADYVSPRYNKETGKSEPSVQNELLNVLYKASYVGKNYAQRQDYALLNKCKEAYVAYEESEDWADAMMGGGYSYKDRSQEVEKFTF